MQNEQQYEQLLLLYTQLKNGAHDIHALIENECYNEALSMLKNRDEILLNCQCIRNYLDLTPVQQNELRAILDELRDLEDKNIRLLEQNKEVIQQELRKTNQNEKLQQAYDFDENLKGSIINYSEE